jgi:sugar lactone lactonase YvrE
MISCIAETSDLLGESPVWDDQQNCLWWIDILGRKLHRHQNEREACNTETWDLEQICGSIGLWDSSALVAATRTGFGRLYPREGKVEHFNTPLSGISDIRFNDGRNDRRGRFWAGTVQEKRVRGAASLYMFEGRSFVEVISGLTVVNGIAWSPDGKIMYFSDSFDSVIYAVDVDRKGNVAKRRVFSQYPPELGTPDGATVDTSGNYWSAAFSGSHVAKFSPDGRLETAIKLPVSHPTSCTFGGPGMSTLYVTSAKARLSEEQKATQPQAGHLFAVSTGESGFVEPRFGAG